MSFLTCKNLTLKLCFNIIHWQIDTTQRTNPLTLVDTSTCMWLQMQRWSGLNMYSNFVCSGSGEDLEDKVSIFITPQSPVKGGPPVSPLRAPCGRTKRARTTSTSKAKDSVVHSGSRTIYTAGRPPWYDSHGQLTEAFVVGECYI